MDLGLTWLGSPEGASKDTGETEIDAGDIQIGKTEKRVHSTLLNILPWQNLSGVLVFSVSLWFNRIGK